MLKALTIAATLVFGLATAAVADPAAITVDHVWARASAGRTGAVYLTINNGGTAADRLVAATTPVAAEAQLHTELNDNGIMKMRRVAAIDVAAHGQAALKPGGLHVMLIGLKQPLKAGTSFPLTLTFDKAGKIDVTVPVEKAGAMDDMPGMKM